MIWPHNIFLSVPRAQTYTASLKSTMKVTSNLSFVLCIGTIAMSVIEASLNGLGPNRSDANKPSLQRQAVFDFAALQSPRGLKSVSAASLLSKRSAATKRATKTQKAVEFAIHEQRRSLQTEDELVASLELVSEMTVYCLVCDTIQSEEACLSFDDEAAVAALVTSPEAFLVDCTAYRSGPFADDTICGIENFVDNNCTFTINARECNSCTVVACDGEETDFDIDCSNIIAGETWNFCTDDIPETSLFIGLGNNDRFQDKYCTGSGGIAASTSHVLGLVGLIIGAFFW